MKVALRLTASSIIYYILCAAIGCRASTDGSIGSHQRMFEAQLRTLRVFDEYMGSGAPDARAYLMNARAEDEILASRILRWFWSYAARGTPYDEWERAERQLLENAHLTLLVIMPILMEDGDSYYEGVYIRDAQDIYLNLCARVAAAEDDGFAMTILNELPENVPVELREIARQMHDWVSNTWNWRNKAAAFRGTGDYSALAWISREKLRKGMSLASVMNLLGEPTSSIGAAFVYKSRTGAERDVFLWLLFGDGMLQAWAFGEDPAVGGADTMDKLVREYIQ